VSQGPVPEDCSATPQDALTLTIPAPRGTTPLTLLVSLDNPEPRGNVDEMYDVRVSARTVSGESVPITRLLAGETFYLVYSVPALAEPVSITLSPIVPIGHIDLY